MVVGGLVCEGGNQRGPVQLLFASVNSGPFSHLSLRRGGHNFLSSNCERNSRSSLRRGLLARLVVTNVGPHRDVRPRHGLDLRARDEALVSGAPEASTFTTITSIATGASIAAGAAIRATVACVAAASAIIAANQAARLCPGAAADREQQTVHGAGNLLLARAG